MPLPFSKLKTREDEREEIRQNPELLRDQGNIRDTNRRELENELYSNECTPIIPDFLYMGSDYVAQTKETLLANRITHIINCAADYCDNYFPDDFIYKKYYLKDSVQENIECCFYDTVAFIRGAAAKNGRVFVHCIQGVSRSATLCIAYIIFDKQLDHQTAFELVQKQRPIANPNMIFNVQLIWWHMRLFKDFSALPISPRVFAISSHQREQPSFIVARLVLAVFMGSSWNTSTARVTAMSSTLVASTLFNPLISSSYGPAAKFKATTGNCRAASDINPRYAETAAKHVTLLQTHEHASSTVEHVKQGEERKEFWQLWGLSGEPETKYRRHNDWDCWFADVEMAEKNKQLEKPMVYSMHKSQLTARAQDEELAQLRALKPRLYTYSLDSFASYPNTMEYVTVFEYDDLAESTLVCLCVKSTDTIYLWRSPSFQASEEVHLPLHSLSIERS